MSMPRAAAASSTFSSATSAVHRAAGSLLSMPERMLAMSAGRSSKPASFSRCDGPARYVASFRNCVFSKCVFVARPFREALEGRPLSCMSSRKLPDLFGRPLATHKASRRDRPRAIGAQSNKNMSRATIYTFGKIRAICVCSDVIHPDTLPQRRKKCEAPAEKGPQHKIR